MPAVAGQQRLWFWLLGWSKVAARRPAAAVLQLHACWQLLEACSSIKPGRECDTAAVSWCHVKH